MNQFGTPPPLSTNPPISEQFFYDPPLCPKQEPPPLPPNFRWGGNYGYTDVIEQPININIT